MKSLNKELAAFTAALSIFGSGAVATGGELKTMAPPEQPGSPYQPGSNAEALMTDTSLETAASEMAARIIYFSRENRLGRIKRNYKYGVATLILPTAYEEQRDQTRNKFYGVWLTTEMAKDGKMLASKPISLEVQALSIHVLDEKAKKFTVGVNDSYIGCCRLSSPDEPIWYGYQYTGYDGFKPRRPGQNISTFKQKPRRYDAKDRAAKADQIVDITQTILRKALSAES